MTSTGRQFDEYADEVGADKAERQAAEARARFGCCGEHRPGHHPMCRNYVEPETLALIEGQETLLP